MFKRSTIARIACLAAASLLLQSCIITSAPKAVVTDASVTEAKIAPEAVTNGKIAANAVLEHHILDGSVTTNKIADNAITTAKLGTISANAFTNYVLNGGQPVALALGTSNATNLTLRTNATTIATFQSDGHIDMGHDETSNYATSVGKYGLRSTIGIQPTAASSELYFGLQGQATHSAGGTSTQAVGVLGRVTQSNGSGTVTTGIGVGSSLQITAAGTITSGYGFHTSVSNTSGLATSTRLTNYRGLWIEDPDGAVTTASANTRYGVFVDGPSVNFFRGNVGIGAASSNPGSALTVSGTTALTGAVTITGATAVTGAISATTTIAAGTALTAGTSITAGTTIEAGTALRVDGVQVCTSAGCTAVSDIRLKDQVEPLTGSLGKILGLRGIGYYFKDKKKFGEEHQVGFSAQEIEKTFPELVRTDKETGLKAVNYAQLVAPLVDAFREFYGKWLDDHQKLEKQQEKIATLEKRIEIENLALKAENKVLKERLEKIELVLARALPTEKSTDNKGRKLASVKGK